MAKEKLTDKQIKKSFWDAYKDKQAEVKEAGRGKEAPTMEDVIAVGQRYEDQLMSQNRVLRSLRDDLFSDL